ncbi:hypothetical protein PENTCL1PPCAC_30612, partial [Pristionchus entomophagus]
IRMFLLLLLMATALASAESDPKGAWILASKKIITSYAVQGKDYVVSYGLYNVGNRPATKVLVFAIRHGLAILLPKYLAIARMKMARLNPGEKITHVVILRSIKYGNYTFSLDAAKVTYSPDVDSKEVRSGFTSTPTKVHFHSLSEYERRFGSNIYYLIVFFLIMGSTSFGALWMYLRSSEKYEDEEN